jgi:hypothetical protein
VGAVEDDEHALAVVVELRALAELLAVLDGEVGDVQELAQKNSSRLCSARIASRSTVSRTCIRRRRS